MSGFVISTHSIMIETNTTAADWENFWNSIDNEDIILAAQPVPMPLFDEMNDIVTFDQSFWEDDGVSLTGNPGAMGKDTIVINYRKDDSDATYDDEHF